MTDKKRGLGRGFGALVDPSRARPASTPTIAHTVEKIHADERVVMVPVEAILPNPYQPRHQFEETALQTLAVSIKRDGILQPLAVRRRAADPSQFELIAGERRLRAAKIVGLAEVPCVLIETDEEGLGLLALVENLLREDLNPLDEAEAYQQIIDVFGLTQEHIAERVGRSRPYITNAIRLLSLPEMVRAYIAGGELSAGHGRALLVMESDEDKIAVAQEILKRQLSVRETESLAKKIALAGRRKKTGNAPAEPKAHPFAYLTDDLRTRYGTKIVLTGNKKQGKIELHYFSEEELTRLAELLLH